MARVQAKVVNHCRAHDRDVGEDRVAVVIITHNRVGGLTRNLYRLLELAERPHVVVVDNASTDGTATAVRSDHPWCELLVLDRNAGASGRNLGVERLSHPYIAFADDDTWWAPGSLRLAADILDEHPDVAVVTHASSWSPQAPTIPSSPTCDGVPSPATRVCPAIRC